MFSFSIKHQTKNIFERYRKDGKCRDVGRDPLDGPLLFVIRAIYDTVVVLEGGRAVRKCRVSYVTWASN